MAITPGKLQTQSSAHASVIRPDTAPAKYLPRLLIYAVIALAVVSGEPSDLARQKHAAADGGSAGASGVAEELGK
jgi:hypothetical protein